MGGNTRFQEGRTWRKRRAVLKWARAERNELRKRLSSSNNGALEVPRRLLQTMRIEERERNTEKKKQGGWIARLSSSSSSPRSKYEGRRGSCGDGIISAVVADSELQQDFLDLTSRRRQNWSKCSAKLFCFFLFFFSFCNFLIIFGLVRPPFLILPFIYFSWDSDLGCLRSSEKHFPANW